jgi:purine-binding chemotaxis protein CheW
LRPAETLAAAAGEQVVCFGLRGQEFAAPVVQVREIIVFPGVTRVPGSPDHVVGVFNLRGRVITLIDISSRLGLAPSEAREDAKILVADVGGHTVGVLADSVSRIITIAPKDLEPPPRLPGADARGLMRALAKHPGGLLMILDLSRLVAGDAAAPPTAP